MIKRLLTLTVLLASMLAASAALRGDVTGDGVVDIDDLNAVINVMVHKNADAGIEARADIDGNGMVDIDDLNTVINVMVGKDPGGDNPEPELADVGIYAGIVGFNDRLYTKPVSLLNGGTRGSFTSFIDGLSSRNGTVLYWAVDSALDMLAGATTPRDLSTVMLVTFTDGLDQGSMMYQSRYTTNDAYLSALQSRIGQRYHGLPLTAFSIGLRGSDVTDVSQFRANLRQLASSDANAVEVSDMSGVNDQLSAIAERLSLVTKTQDLRVTIPGQADGTRIRFTFDGVSDAANSQLYIEGTFRLSDRSLRNVAYQGITSTSGATVSGTVSGIFVTYQFLNTRRASTGEILPTGSIRQWSYVTSTGKWQRNSEFTPSTDIQQSVSNSSALVALALDCSSSLSSQFSTMKTHAKSFVQKLAAAAPPAVTASVDELKFEAYVGSPVKKTLTVSGVDLRGSITATITSGGEVFSVSPSSISQSSASSGATVTVTYAPTSAGTHTGELRLSSDGVSSVTVRLQGTAEEWTPPGPADAKVYTVNGVSFKMVAIEGGTFTMGATAEQGSDYYSDERPTHQVTLTSYAIGATEVTQALWVAVMGSNPSYFSSRNGYTDNLQRPVETVYWDDCQTFITKLNELTGATFRLPTEAEWEYAARGGNKSKGYKYAGSNSIGDVAWYWSNIPSKSNVTSGYGTQTVATKVPNELGLYDMSGNVWEWCQDWWGSYSSGAQTNPTGPASGTGRVNRGGSWADFARDCRVSYRYSSGPSYTDDYLGFRLAL